MSKLRSAEELWDRLAEVKITDEEVIQEIKAYTVEVVQAVRQRIETIEVRKAPLCPGGWGAMANDPSSDVEIVLLADVMSAVALPEDSRDRLGRALYDGGDHVQPWAKCDNREYFCTRAAAVIAEQEKINNEAG